MIEQKYADIVTPELLQGAIENREFEGFLEDYHILHALLRKYNPNSVFEIGTNCGRGTSIICNAIPDAKVYSLDLPTELAHISLQHPINEGHGDRVGYLCQFPFTQLRGDSMTFDFSKHICEAYYIDGEHSYKNVFLETTNILNINPQLIIWHDTNIPEVCSAIIDVFNNHVERENYYLCRVTNTRISYAKRKMEKIPD